MKNDDTFIVQSTDVDDLGNSVRLYLDTKNSAKLALDLLKWLSPRVKNPEFLSEAIDELDNFLNLD